MLYGNKFENGGSMFASMMPSYIQGIAGITQSIMGGLSNPQRPINEVPESIRQATALAERGASSSTLPGQASILGQIDQSSASALNTIKEMQGGNVDAGAAVVDVLGKKNEALTNLNIAGANYQAQQKKNLQGALQTQGAYEDKAFDYNQAQRFAEEAAATSALKQAGLSNIYNSAKDISGIVAYNDLLKSGDNGIGSNMYAKLFGNQQANSAKNTANNISNFYSANKDYLKNLPLINILGT